MKRSSSSFDRNRETRVSRALESSRGFLQSEWRHFAAGFSRERFISGMKTLAWVVPLTLLIWIYAERETLWRPDPQSVPIDPVGDANRIVTVIRPVDKNFILKLEGPRAKLQSVLQELQGGMNPRGLKIDIPSAYGTDVDTPIPALSLVQEQKIFRDNGISVVDCQPPTLHVRIDSVAELKVPVQAPPEIQNLDGPPTFDPAEVTLRGPKKLLDQIRRDKLAVQADLGSVSMRRPDHYDLTDVPLELPSALRDEPISITPPKVNAKVTIREADASYAFDSIAVYVSVPPPGDFLRRYKIVYKASLPDVAVIGPKDIIDTISKPGYAPLPNATLKIVEEDALKKGKQSKTVTYDLGNTALRVSDKDKNRQVEFELIEIPAAERPSGD